MDALQLLFPTNLTGPVPAFKAELNNGLAAAKLVELNLAAVLPQLQAKRASLLSKMLQETSQGIPPDYATEQAMVQTGALITADIFIRDTELVMYRNDINAWYENMTSGSSGLTFPALPPGMKAMLAQIQV